MPFVGAGAPVVPIIVIIVVLGMGGLGTPVVPVVVVIVVIGGAPVVPVVVVVDVGRSIPSPALASRSLILFSSDGWSGDGMLCGVGGKCVVACDRSPYTKSVSV